MTQFALKCRGRERGGAVSRERELRNAK